MCHLWRWGDCLLRGYTQSNPLAMAIYALAVKLLIGKLKLESPNVKQVWYADDATGTGTCEDLRPFRHTLQTRGDIYVCIYGYHPNASKTSLMIKAEHAEKARELFAGRGINITTEGKQHLGAAAVPDHSLKNALQPRFYKKSDEIKQLTNITKTQPHAIYCAYTHGLSSCRTFLFRTTLDIADLLQPLEETIQQHLIPILTGHSSCSSVERYILALPVHMGVMGLVNPKSSSQSVFNASFQLTSPLVSTIVRQDQNHS